MPRLKRHVLPCKSEHEEQAELLVWAELMAARYPDLALLYAIPNGARTSIRTAVKVKREGLKAGVPDLHLPVARQGYHGLYLELKRERGGVVGEAQAAWHTALRLAGHRVDICRGACEAESSLVDYLSS